MIRWRAFLAGCLIAGGLLSPIEHCLADAAESSAAASSSQALAMSEGYSFEAAAEGRGVARVRLRCAIRAAVNRGKIDSEQGQEALRLLNKPDSATNLCRALADFRVDQLSSGYTGPVIDGITKLLDYLIENWDQIWKIVQTIIDLFVWLYLRGWRLRAGPLGELTLVLA